jgi:hypothetical protein
MSKRNVILMLSLLLASTSLTHAQGLFQMGKKPEKTVDTTLSAPSKTILAPEDFNSAVTDLNKQNQAAFKKQVDQKVAQVGSPNVQPAPEAPQSKNGSSSDSTSPIPAPTPDEEPTAAPAQDQNNAANKKPATTSNSAAPGTTKPQVYTGFSGGSDASSSGSGSSGSSGGSSNKGWSIKY